MENDIDNNDCAVKPVIPFEMKIPASVPVSIGGVTKELFNMELQKGLDDIAAGRVISVDAVEAEMKSLYGL